MWSHNMPTAFEINRFCLMKFDCIKQLIPKNNLKKDHLISRFYLHARMAIINK